MRFKCIIFQKRHIYQGTKMFIYIYSSLSLWVKKEKKHHLTSKLNGFSIFHKGLLLLNSNFHLDINTFFWLTQILDCILLIIVCTIQKIIASNMIAFLLSRIHRPHLQIHKYFTDNSSVMTRYFFIFCQILAKNEEKSSHGNLRMSYP